MDNGYGITDLQYLYFISSKGTTLQKVSISNTPSHYPASAFADHQKTGALVSAF